MKNWIFILLILGAMLVSVWGGLVLPNQLIVGSSLTDETSITPKWFVLIFIPLIMAVLYVINYYLNKIGSDSEEFSNLKNTISSIFLSIQFILLITHCFIIFNGTRMNLNVDIISPLVTGITFIVTGNYMPRFKEKSYMMTSQPEILQKIISKEGTRKLFFNMSRIFVISGFLMLVTVILPSGINIITFFILLFVSVITLIFNISYYIYKFRT
ncbi:hypothetical protein SAMN04487943_102487 [Gracilibacillus orientalis]|uniref:Immunity protein SdpI n=1 Tax=Gracilibacillus orientalis TaxID=334253 RepID=A0A1I4J731_9BACI|nr:hypothetical protein [Gracilibacillus orientalis]SFL62031.1 hypothetical protein SAMN04487943_102487 [Gracilibacillus orientalis]